TRRDALAGRRAHLPRRARAAARAAGEFGNGAGHDGLASPGAHDHRDRRRDREGAEEHREGGEARRAHQKVPRTTNAPPFGAGATVTNVALPVAGAAGTTLGREKYRYAAAAAPTIPTANPTSATTASVCALSAARARSSYDPSRPVTYPALGLSD